MSAVTAMSLALQAQSADPRITTVLEYLHLQPLDTLPTIREFALTFSISESYLRHKFKEIVGLSFREYVRRLRFHRAKALLEGGGITVKCARLEIGMLDHSSFARAYKKYFGEAPTITKRRADNGKWKFAMISQLSPVEMKKLA
jgi:AraC-like DNA-binding protein